MRGSFQTDTPYEFMDSLTNEGSEYAMEMIPGKAGDVGEFYKIQIVRVVVLDVIYDAI
jgi:hypothetical protein